MTPVDGGVSIRLKVTPGASKDSLGCLDDETLKVKLRARAVEGAANRALLCFLSEVLGIRKSSLSISRGSQSRDKTVLVHGASLEGVKRALTGPPA